jgi:hypothetical protein
MLIQANTKSCLKGIGKWGSGEVGDWGSGGLGDWGSGEVGKWGSGEVGKWGKKPLSSVGVKIFSSGPTPNPTKSFFGKPYLIVCWVFLGQSNRQERL